MLRGAALPLRVRPRQPRGRPLPLVRPERRSGVAAGSGGAGGSNGSAGFAGSILDVDSDVKMTAVPSSGGGKGRISICSKLASSVDSCAGFRRHRCRRCLCHGLGTRLARPWLRLDRPGVNSAQSRADGAGSRLRCRSRNRRLGLRRRRRNGCAQRLHHRGQHRDGRALCRRRLSAGWRGVRDGGLRRGVGRAEPQHDIGDGRHLIGFRGLFRQHGAPPAISIIASTRCSNSSQHRGGGSRNRPRPWPGRWPAPSRQATVRRLASAARRRGPPPPSGRAPPESARRRR